MPIAQLRIQQTPLLLGIHTRKPVQEIQQPHAELNLRQVAAVLEIRQPTGKLSIDSSEARRNIGVKTNMQFSDSNASYGYQMAMEAIAKASSDGDRLMAIEHGGNPIADIAFEWFSPEGGIDIPPLSGDLGVKIDYQAQPVEIHVKRGGMRMDPVLKPPILKYTPGKVEPYVRQWNHVKIEVVGLFVDRSV